MKKVLITGAAGYLGSTLIGQLLDKDYKVTAIDNFTFSTSSLNSYFGNPNFEAHKIDVRNTREVNNLLAKHDIVIPLAALVGAPLCEFKKDAAESINFKSISNIVDNLSEDQIILYPTTNSGYGVGKEGEFCTEESPLNPISTYGVTKVNAEKYTEKFKNHINFRLATVFGVSPRMRQDLLVNDFVFKAFFDKYVVLFESHFKRNYIHVKDVARAFIFALENESKFLGETFNLGLSTANLSKMELCQKIKEHIPSFVIMESEIGKDIDKRNYIVSNEKIESRGYAPIYDLDKGIKELIKYYSTIIPNSSIRNF